MPEKTLLYKTVQRYFETFVQLFEERSGGTLPKYIRREFEDYLGCGIPAHGFLKITCDVCNDKSVLAFSCKRRGYCPSCGARKMAETGAYLTDWVLPNTVGYRQYVLTVPMPLRHWIARSPKLMTKVYRIFAEEISRWIEKDSAQSSLEKRDITSGSITFIQYFGDGTRFHPHYHLLTSEGGWYESETQAQGLEFMRSEPPNPQELCLILEKIQVRIINHLIAIGLVKKDASDAETSGAIQGVLEGMDDSLKPEEALLHAMQDQSLNHRFELSNPPGKKVTRVGSEVGLFGAIGDRAKAEESGIRLVKLKGFTLHAQTAIAATPPYEEPAEPGYGALERLLRYMARPSTSLERLKPASGGDVLIKLKTRWSDGTTHLRFTGVELCERLASLIPRPRAHIIRFAGCFAPRHHLRSQVVALAPEAMKKALEPPPQPALAPIAALPGSAPPTKKPYYSWAVLMARIFKEDVLLCKKCGGDLKITAAILERDVIVRILTDMNILTSIPRFDPPARAPPSEEPGFTGSMDEYRQPAFDDWA
jgi:hypothetical protein